MPVKLSIEITAPVEQPERDLIAAVSMLLFALGQQGQPAEEETPDEVPVEPPDPPAPDEALVHAMPGPAPAPCSKAGPDATYCVAIVGHRGRHLFRRIAVPGVN